MMSDEQKLETLQQLKQARRLVTLLEMKLKADKPSAIKNKPKAKSTDAPVKSAGTNDDVAGILLSNHIIAEPKGKTVKVTPAQRIDNSGPSPVKSGMATLIQL